MAKTKAHKPKTKTPKIARHTFAQNHGAERWHLRKLNGTVALCGGAVVWNITLPITARVLVLICPDCAAAFERLDDLMEAL
jgi:hypothetical protein